MDTVGKVMAVLGKFVFLPLGALLLAAAVYVFWDTQAWLARSVEASGSVVEMVRVRDFETGSVRFAPLVKFQTRDGRAVEFQSGFSSNPPSYFKGEAVTVLYDPAKPNSAALSGTFTVWGAPIILFFIGIVFVAVGIAAWVASTRLAQSTALAAGSAGGSK